LTPLLDHPLLVLRPSVRIARVSPFTYCFAASPRFLLPFRMLHQNQADPVSATALLGERLLPRTDIPLFFIHGSPLHGGRPLLYPSILLLVDRTRSTVANAGSLQGYFPFLRGPLRLACSTKFSWVPRSLGGCSEKSFLGRFLPLNGLRVFPFAVWAPMHGSPSCFLVNMEGIFVRPSCLLYRWHSFFAWSLSICLICPVSPGRRL